jgi:hypothetical protein
MSPRNEQLQTRLRVDDDIRAHAVDLAPQRQHLDVARPGSEVELEFAKSINADLMFLRSPRTRVPRRMTVASWACE